MFDEINVLWWWKIGTWFVVNAAKQNPDTTFNLITRNKSKFIDNELFYIKNIKVYDYTDDVNKNLPCFYCVSVNEQKVIEEEWSRNKNINRVLILKHNLKIAYEMLDYIEKIKPKFLFVVTNPVEVVSTFLHTKLQNTQVFWLWLELDSKRIKDLLSLFFNLNIDRDLFVLWNHSLFPIPLLSNTLIYDKLKNMTISDILLNLKDKKNYNYCNTEIDYYEEFYNYINLECLDIWLNDLIPIEKVYEIISYFTWLLVKSEFSNNKPPVKNPVDSLVLTASKLLDFKENIINVSYFSNTWVYTWWLLKINWKWEFNSIDIKISDYEKDMIYKWDLKMCVSFIDVLI